MADNERARLRSIMYEPSAVWLASDYGGDRWLTDQYVLYNVTDSEVVRDLEDGAYQLMASGEWRAEARDSVPPPDVQAYLEIVSAYDWRAAQPTEWSIAEHPGKAMLWAAGGPCLLGESTWTSIKRHYPDVEVDWAPNEGAGLFRFWYCPYHVDPDGDCAGGDCACPEVVFAYAAGIRVPEGQEEVASAVAAAA